MALPGYNKDAIGAAKKAIDLRIQSTASVGDDTDANVGKNTMLGQERELTRRKLSRDVIGLLLLGYLITTLMLLLSGSQLDGFYLEPNILIALIVTTMGGTVAYMFRKVVDFAFG